jgi:hypothetical protein
MNYNCRVEPLLLDECHQPTVTRCFNCFLTLALLLSDVLLLCPARRSPRLISGCSWAGDGSAAAVLVGGIKQAE